MNPSPSGYFHTGTSTPVETQRYLSKISGPLLDRIDLHIEVEPVPFAVLAKKQLGESSAKIRERVTAARLLQKKRFYDFENVHYNAQMNAKQLRYYCRLDPAGEELIKNAIIP